MCVHACVCVSVCALVYACVCTCVLDSQVLYSCFVCPILHALMITLPSINCTMLQVGRIRYVEVSCMYKLLATVLLDLNPCMCNIMCFKAMNEKIMVVCKVYHAYIHAD